MKGWGVEVEGLAELRRDIKRAITGTPSELRQAIKEAGAPILAAVRPITAHKSGRLAGGWRITAGATSGTLTNRVPYVGGAVWGKRGRWQGFARYGQPPRFGPEAIERAAPEIQAILSRHLATIVTFYGWGSIDG